MERADAVQTVVAERDAVVVDRDGQQRPAAWPRIAADLEDVGAVRSPSSSSSATVDPRAAWLTIRTRSSSAVAADQPVAGDPDRPPDQLVERMDLRVRVAVRARVGHLDAAAVVAADRALEQDRARPADAQDRARQQPGVAVVQPEPARVRVDVAERVGQQEQVAVLEDLDRPEVRRPRDRAVP